MERKISIIFWIFWGASIVLTLVEAVTYSGFIIKHLKFNPLIIILFSVVFGLILLILNLRNKNKKSREGYRAAIIFSSFLFVMYVVLEVADSMTYANFVFSNLHIQPNNLLWPFLISLLAIVVQVNFRKLFNIQSVLAVMVVWIPQVNFRKLFNIQSVLILFAFTIVAFNIYKTCKMEKWAFQFIITYPKASYDDKMRRAVGPEFYNFTQFINKNTPENSSILIPPQAFPWPQSGNEAFMRYFIHPRKMRNDAEYESKADWKDFNYVVLNWGETDSVQPPYTHGWPKFDVPAERIIFMNLDGSYGGEIKGDYHYKDYKDKKVWGLIVVKH